MQQNNHIHVSDFSLNLFDLYRLHFFLSHSFIIAVFFIDSNVFLIKNPNQA